MTNTVTGEATGRAQHPEIYRSTPACAERCPACSVRCAVITAMRADHRRLTADPDATPADRATAFRRFASADRARRAARAALTATERTAA